MKEYKRSDFPKNVKVVKPFMEIPKNTKMELAGWCGGHFTPKGIAYYRVVGGKNLFMTRLEDVEEI
jgi:hypothetical protein